MPGALAPLYAEEKRGNGFRREAGHGGRGQAAKEGSEDLVRGKGIRFEAGRNRKSGSPARDNHRCDTVERRGRPGNRETACSSHGEKGERERKKARMPFFEKKGIRA